MSEAAKRKIAAAQRARWARGSELQIKVLSLISFLKQIVAANSTGGFSLQGLTMSCG
jgi:hypothetical protein